MPHPGRSKACTFSQLTILFANQPILALLGRVAKNVQSCNQEKRHWSLADSILYQVPYCSVPCTRLVQHRLGLAWQLASVTTPSGWFPPMYPRLLGQDWCCRYCLSKNADCGNKCASNPASFGRCFQLLPLLIHFTSLEWGVHTKTIRWDILEQIYTQSVVKAAGLLRLLLIPFTSMLLFLRFGKLHPTRKLEWWQRRVVDQAW